MPRANARQTECEQLETLSEQNAVARLFKLSRRSRPHGPKKSLPCSAGAAAESGVAARGEQERAANRNPPQSRAEEPAATTSCLLLRARYRQGLPRSVVDGGPRLSAARAGGITDPRSRFADVTSGTALRPTPRRSGLCRSGRVAVRTRAHPGLPDVFSL